METPEEAYYAFPFKVDDPKVTYEIPGGQGDCKVTRQQRSGSTVTAAFSCANPPSTGESQITFTSPESYRMRTTATTSVGGSAEKMTVEGSGRWLGADCGNVKPVGTPGN